eukprot:7457055-Pyramimonas_sp.AAC.1
MCIRDRAWGAARRRRRCRRAGRSGGSCSSGSRPSGCGSGGGAARGWCGASSHQEAPQLRDEGGAHDGRDEGWLGARLRRETGGHSGHS